MDSNNGWINGGLDRRVEAVVGNNIRLNAQPMYALLGKDFKWRMGWAGTTQALFKVWANDIHFRCDARKRMNFGKMVNLAYLQYVRDGEVAGEIRMKDRGARFQTNVLLIDCDRLETPPLLTTDNMVRNGVRYDESNAPIGYYFRKRHSADTKQSFDALQYEYIPATGRTGKSKVVHVFNPRRIEQGRGISRLVEAMIPAKMLDRSDREEIKAQVKDAMLSIFIESPAPTSEIEGAIAPGSDSQMSSGYYDELIGYRSEKPLRWNNADVGHLFPGEKVVTPSASRSSSNYDVFQATFLRKIAGVIGVSYPQLSQNWADINYSSARALLNEMWRSFLQDREWFTQSFCRPIYAAWLEEAIAMGEIKMPGGPANFYRRKTEITNCEWYGPSRGSVDPLKEANANNLDTASGRVSTVELISERGRDPDDVLQEEVYWKDAREEKGLATPNLNVKAAAEAGDEAASGAGSEADRDGDGITNEEQRKKPAQRGNGA
jgi:lambda family phage portal protein